DRWKRQPLCEAAQHGYGCTPDAGRPTMNPDDYKRQAAARALDFVEPGMRLGLGTGSTAAHFIDLLGPRGRAGPRLRGVPTSQAPHAHAERVGISLTTLDDTPELDLTVDGADEIAPDLSLIKGGGGALLCEKIVAAASARMVVIADHTKWVALLGHFPLPVEVVPFGVAATPPPLEAARPGAVRPKRPPRRPAGPAPRNCGGTRTAILSSRTAATSSSMPRCSAFRGRMFSPRASLRFPAWWSTGSSSGWPARP